MAKKAAEKKTPSSSTSKRKTTKRSSTARSKSGREKSTGGTEVKSEVRRYKKGTATSGLGGKGGKVKSRKQAVAIGLSKARAKGKKVPARK